MPPVCIHCNSDFPKTELRINPTPCISSVLSSKKSSMLQKNRGLVWYCQLDVHAHSPAERSDRVMPNTSKPIIANLYNPHEQNNAQLIERFIVRQRVFQEIFQEIKSSAMTKPECPYLIEGQRGMGKTTLLLRLSYEIEHDPELSSWLRPIVLKEEAYYGIRQLFKLWGILAQELEGKDRSFYGLSRQMQDARQNIQTSSSALARYEQTCFEILVHALRNRSQKILLCIDNLGEMLHNFTEQENLRFREILTTCSHIRLIGATSIVFEAIQNGKLAHLLHNVFTTIQLEGLTKSETHELFLALAKTSQKETQFYTILAQHPGRIEALRILTGGVIRTLVLLFEIFAGSQNENSLTDLEDILDRVTPLYQNRMNDLTALQRDVVNAIALQWDAVTPEDVARATYLSTADVLTVLEELKKIQIVQHLITEDHQRFYQLRERFFNIWYLMRLAPGDSRSRVLWLLHFLESWYDRGELVRQARKHTEAITAKRYTPRSAYYLTEALVRTGQLDMNTENRMIQATRALLQEFDAELMTELSRSDKDLFNEAEACDRHGDYKNAAAHLLQIKRKNDRVYCRLGESFSKLARYDDAIQAFVNAVEHGNVEAMIQVAELYHEILKDYHAAETYYSMAVKQKSIEAMFALGNLYHHKLKNYNQAKTCYVMAIKEGQQRSAALISDRFSFKALKQYLMPNLNGEHTPSESQRPDDVNRLRGQYLENIKRIGAEAMLQLGNLYARELNDSEKAIAYYHGAIKGGIREAIVQLALLYQYTLNDYKKAAKYYTIALKHGEDRYAAVNLGILYQEVFKDYNKAERYYLLAVKNDQAAGMNGLAWLYFEQKHHKQEALRYAKQAADKEKTIYTAHTLACIYLWNNQPDDALRVAREFMYDQESYTHLNQDILLYLMLLLAKKQHDALVGYFETPDLNLRERFKPFYYAFLYHTKDPDYYKRPTELIEPIGGLIGRIQRLTASYA